VTAAGVQDFARRRLAAAEASIVIVGKADEFLEPLRKAFEQVEVIPYAELDLNGAALRKAKAGPTGGG
jgi:zinc protease